MNKTYSVKEVIGRDVDAHVFFYSVPVGAIFVHNGEEYIKMSNEIVCASDGMMLIFEPHYGCVVSKSFAETHRCVERV